MHSMSSMSRLGSSKAIRAAVKIAARDKVGGPMGGIGCPPVLMNSLWDISSSSANDNARRRNESKPTLVVSDSAMRWFPAFRTEEGSFLCQDATLAKYSAQAERVCNYQPVIHRSDWHQQSRKVGAATEEERRRLKLQGG